MWYAIMAQDIEGSLPLRKATREQHLARMRPLVDAGRVLLAGPHPAIDSPEPGDEGFTGSLLVIEFDSLDEAKQWAQDDPYMAAGVYASVTVKPLLRVLP